MKGENNMGKIVVRHNFETNSSSMHSLSIRREEGEYTTEELRRSEAMWDTHDQDAIITMNEGHVVTEDEIRKTSWIYDNKMRIWGHHMDLAHSAMQVMSSFRDKLTYALATVYGYKYQGAEKRLGDIKAVCEKYLPGVTINAEIHEWDSYQACTNQYLLYPFLRMNKITIEEFLTNTKYIVIINYAEYEKMKWLNMVDESQIADVYYPHINDSFEMKIEDGVWKLSEGDIYFGRSPFRVLGTPEGKARYALARAHSKNIDEILTIMQEIYPEMTGIELPKDEYSDDGIARGYVDDWGVIPDDLSTRDLILNKKYVIISDGDEYCVWSNFKKTPLFNQKEYPNEKRKGDY
jgi:hypothetical protein